MHALACVVAGSAVGVVPRGVVALAGDGGALVFGAEEDEGGGQGGVGGGGGGGGGEAGCGEVGGGVGGGLACGEGWDGALVGGLVLAFVVRDERVAYAGGEVGEAKEEQGEGCDGVHGWLVLGCSWVLYVCSWCGAPSLVVELLVVQNQEGGGGFCCCC